MINYKSVVRRRLESLASYVEEHNAGSIRGASDISPFTLAQAESYVRFYQGYKREVQEQSIEANLIEPDDPLYGWGWIAQHEPIAVATGPSLITANTEVGKKFSQRDLERKRLQTAELQVHKRQYIMATIPMYILRATIAPIIIPDIKAATIQSRLSRVARQVDSPGLAEQINRLRCFNVEGGVRVIAMNDDDDFQIGPIN